MEIISKGDGGDRRERELKRVLRDNRHTIDRLARHLTKGALPTQTRAETAPVITETGRTFGFRQQGVKREIEPWVRISPNDRVVLMDTATSRQVAFLGVLRGPRHDRVFVLATRENGFIAPVDDERADALRHLDGCGLQGPDAEEELARHVAAALGIRMPDEAKDGD
jgi:hypothetical protein